MSPLMSAMKKNEGSEKKWAIWVGGKGRTLL